MALRHPFSHVSDVNFAQGDGGQRWEKDNGVAIASWILILRCYRTDRACTESWLGTASAFRGVGTEVAGHETLHSLIKFCLACMCQSRKIMFSQEYNI